MFEKYYKNLGAVTKDKEKLLEEFSNFLDDPMLYGGFFVIRATEDKDGLENTMSLQDFIDTMK